jgi:PHP family Zn ribbon phosphoesterase
MAEKYHDRFSEAEEELSEKSAFTCTSCNKKYHKKDAEKKDMQCCGKTMKELIEESFGP